MQGPGVLILSTRTPGARRPGPLPLHAVLPPWHRIGHVADFTSGEERRPIEPGAGGLCRLLREGHYCQRGCKLNSVLESEDPDGLRGTSSRTPGYVWKLAFWVFFGRRGRHQDA